MREPASRLRGVIAPPRLRALALPAAVALLTAYLLWSSWLRWADAWVDFGFFLYDGWLVSEGSRIGRDLHYFYGPLALHFYAFLFRLTGPAVTAVYVVNAALLAADAFLVQRFFRAYSRESAAAALLCFLGVFAMGQYVYNGNYNYLAPYKPEIALGTPLLLLLVLVASRESARRRDHLLFGVLAGALSLTSTELALAAFAALAVRFVARPPRAACLATLTAGAALAPLVSMGLLGDSPAAAFRALTIPFRRSLVFAPAMKEYMGLDFPLTRLGIAVGTFGAALALGALVVLAPRFRRGSSAVFPPAVLAAAALGSLAFGAARAHFWLLFPKCLPFVPLIGLVLWASDRRRHLATGVWSAASLALLLRVIGNVRIFHYGFSLAFGATLLIFPLLFELLPAALARRSYRAEGARVLGWLLCLALLAAALPQRAGQFGAKTLQISGGRDVLFDEPVRGAAVKALLDTLAQRLRPGDQVLGLPFGHVVNYLLRARRPGPYSLALGDRSEFSDAEILASYRKARPRFVFVSAEGGFGDSYGKEFLAWLRDDYHPVARFPAQSWELSLYEAR